MSSEISVNLNQFITKGLNEALVKGLTQAGALVSNAAKRGCPKDTGNLRRSIEFEVDDSDLETVIYSNCEYAPYVEIGTGIYSSKGTGRKTPWTYKGRHGFKRTSGNPPQPFLEPALINNKSDILNCFEGLI